MSVFGDPSSLPWTVDFEGPNSSVLERTVQIRYRSHLEDKYRFTASIEAPTADIQTADSIDEPYQSFPDLVSSLRREEGKVNVQLAGLFRNINVKTASGEKEKLFGYGFLFSGKYKLSLKHDLLWQFVYGQGIARYITALTGRNMDVVYNPITGKFETLGVYGGYLSLGVVWAEHLSSYFTPGFTAAINKEYQPDDAFRFSGYFSANIFWDVIREVRVGAEYSYGSRINKDGDHGDANRFSFIVYYDF